MIMRDSLAKTTYLKDYEPPEFCIKKTSLSFDLYEDKTLVTSHIEFFRNKNFLKNPTNSLLLDGQDLDLESICLNDVELKPEQYSQKEESLAIPNLNEILSDSNEKFTMTCVVKIKPQDNTSLEGLYKSKDKFCTQCEAEGFRKITYYLDRPDVMSSFTTKITADKDKYPVLLSNGNKIDEGIVEGDPNRHWVCWEDPFRKPSYLFALVAGIWFVLMMNL